MSKPAAGVAIRRGSRRDRTIQPHDHDMYRMPRKPEEPSRCPDCGATFERGRWNWGRKTTEAAKLRCPACSRIRDRAPMGIVTLSGEFLQQRREEIMNLVSHEEATAKGAHPLARLMGVEDNADRTVISTTDLHLARRIGEALHDAYGGELRLQYLRGRDFVRVTWQR